MFRGFTAHLRQSQRENLDAEIFDTSLVEAEEAGHKVLIVDTTRGLDEEALIEKLREKLGA